MNRSLCWGRLNSILRLGRPSPARCLPRGTQTAPGKRGNTGCMTTMARPGLDASLLDSAYAAVADGVASGTLASGVLAVATSDELVRLEAFGPVTTDSIFLIASITKPIFATSVLRLVE